MVVGSVVGLVDSPVCYPGVQVSCEGCINMGLYEFVAASCLIRGEVTQVFYLEVMA